MHSIRVSGRELAVELERRLAEADEALNRQRDPAARAWHALGMLSGHRTLPEHGGPAGGWPNEIGGGLATLAARIGERRNPRFSPTAREATADARLAAVCRYLVGADGELVVDVENARIFEADAVAAFRDGRANQLRELELAELLEPCRGLTTLKLRSLLERPVPSVDDALARMGDALEELGDA